MRARSDQVATVAQKDRAKGFRGRSGRLQGHSISNALTCGQRGKHRRPVVSPFMQRERLAGPGTTEIERPRICHQVRAIDASRRFENGRRVGWPGLRLLHLTHGRQVTPAAEVGNPGIVHADDVVSASLLEEVNREVCVQLFGAQ